MIFPRRLWKWSTDFVPLLLISALWRWHSHRSRHGDWRRDARRQLRLIRRRLAKQGQQQIAGELSQLMRRIAIARCGRRACAGLVGDPWLVWLTHNDPRGFDWRTRGRLLLELPYAPPQTVGSKEALNALIGAALGWVITKNKRVNTRLERSESRDEGSPKGNETVTDV